jgi:uncharacterized phage protein gp47/JayE
MAYNYIESTGTVVADTGANLQDVQAEYKATFGADLIVTPDTPQGVLISAETETRTSVSENNANLANQINPNLAGGIFLDAIWALTGGARKPATRSTISAVNLTGSVGTIIPSGSLAKTITGQEFETISPVTINGFGLASVDFQSVLTGPIAANANTLTQIVSGVLGWETVTNPNSAVLGQDTESDGESRQRRRETLALQGRSTSEAIYGNIRDVSGVTSLQFRENVTGATQIIDGVSLVEHSTWVCVDGGLNVDVAIAYLEGKSAGSDFNGAVLVPIIAPGSGQTIVVKFDRPTLIPVRVRVTARVTTAVSDPTTTITNAVLDYAAGEINGEAGFVVGGSVSPFEIASAINYVQSGLYITLVEVAYAVPVPIYVTTTIPIAIFEQASTNSTLITVILV